MPVVTVVLNTYQRPELLTRAIDSVFAQTLTDWELIICDDASEDGTPEVARRFAADPRVCYLRQSARTGNVTRGRNDAIDHAHGRYVAFLDDDNAMAPEKLDRMVAFLEARPDLAMAYCRSRRLGLDGTLLDLLPMNKPPQFDWGRLRQLNYIDSNEVLVRAEAFRRAGGFDERAVRFEDWEMWNRIALVGGIEGIDEPLSWYCTHPTQRVLEPANDEDNQNTRHLFAWKLAHGYPRWRVLVAWPSDCITRSQQDCMDAIEADLADQDWIDPRYTLAQDMILREQVEDYRPALLVLFMPFRHPMATFQALRGTTCPTVGVCVEDPFAVTLNLERAFMLDAVLSNEARGVEIYRAKDRPSAVMPTLSASEVWDVEAPDCAVTHDVVHIGYAYPERVVALRNLALDLPKVRFLTMGGAWDEAILPENVTVEGDVARREIVTAYRRGRIVLILNRMHGMPGQLAPITPGRGFIEAMSGRPVLHDGRRGQLDHYFELGTETLAPESRAGMVDAIRFLLSQPDRAAGIGERGRTRALAYTYRKRWQRMVNMLTAGRVANVT